VKTRAEGVQVTGKLGFSGHPMIEHFKFVAAHTKATPKITIPAPSALYGRPAATPIDKQVYPDWMVLRRSRPGLPQGGARLRRRRLPLSAARRGVHRHAVRPKYREQMTRRGDDPEKLGRSTAI
jgi:5-methyltetrahydropteroyltriglutamate--homocysteine methyltransferase